MAEQTKYADRAIPKISLHDFDNRIDEITAQLCHAAETDGFFALTSHGIPSSTITSMFALSRSFFSLPHSSKSTVPFSTKNVGWEHTSQIRPSTGAPDQKESYQLQFGSNMAGMWISDSLLPGFEAKAKSFMRDCQSLSEKIMICFARGLGFKDGYFVKAHDVSRENIQSVLRLLHYFPCDPEKTLKEDYHRAGPHADWDFITLLFQAEAGMSGLEICPGREAVTEFGIGDTWTEVGFGEGEIVCNIGDMLMSWSDDRFKSTFHRVKTPRDGVKDWFGDRYSMAYFNQPCTDTVVGGKEGKYGVMTAEEFTKRAMERNYRALEEKRRAMEEAKWVAVEGTA